MKKFMLSAVIAFLLTLSAIFATTFISPISPAHSQVVCFNLEAYGGYEVWKDKWKKKHGEVVKHTALVSKDDTSKEHVILLTMVDDKDGSFTLLVLKPNNSICPLVSGYKWRDKVIEPEGEEL